MHSFRHLSKCSNIQKSLSESINTFFMPYFYELFISGRKKLRLRDIKQNAFIYKDIVNISSYIY